MSALERDLVSECHRSAEAMGAMLAVVGQHRAKNSGTTRGFPDMVLLCCGQVRFIETKRPKTAEQFNGSGSAVAHATRPLSITIIAWLMIVSGVFMLPWPSFSLNLPAFFLGITFGGLASKLFYLAYMTAYVAVGVGLLRERPVALTAAIVLHALSVLNSLTMAVPSVWANYQRVIRSMSPMFANEPTRPSVQFFSVGSGIVVGSLILYFLLKAKRK